MVGVALLLAVVVQTSRFQSIDGQRRLAERQVEELKKVLPPEIRPGWLNQVNAGPGHMFRGALPAGDWRLAVYTWRGEGVALAKVTPPPGMAPLAAQRIPNPADVDIQISEAELPAGMTYNGNPVDRVFNVEIKDTRADAFFGRIFKLPPLLVQCVSGAMVTVTGAPSRPNESHLLMYNGYPGQISNLFLVQVEPYDPSSPKPQLGKDDLPDNPKLPDNAKRSF